MPAAPFSMRRRRDDALSYRLGHRRLAAGAMGPDRVDRYRDSELADMTADLRRLAEQAASESWPPYCEDNALSVEDYIAAANPQAILALLDERDALREDYTYNGQQWRRRVAALEEGLRELLDRLGDAEGPALDRVRALLAPDHDHPHGPEDHWHTDPAALAAEVEK